MRNLVIVGSGPAGYTAALYASRADLKPLLFEGDQPGGQLTITTDVENYPGFPKGIMGPELMELMKAQAERFGTECRLQRIERIDLSKRPFHLWNSEGEEVVARSIIVATGASAKLLGLPREAELMSHGLSACATCDGAFYRGKELLVVGGGDTAMEEATFLTRYATKVTVVHRRESLRASKVMQERARSNPKIDWLWNAEIIEYIANAQNKLVGAKLRSTKDGRVWEQATGGVFLAIGHQPNTSFLGGQLELEPTGYVKLFGGTRTSVEGVFACGDVADAVYRQAVTAAGSGCAAALEAERWLAAQGVH
ncbi:MAG: thioredoxin-disulfide reductase [Planctomycetes bacterium]|nr:thioredoxin-disulfide reductase [Planctomycetota bacterium]